MDRGDQTEVVAAIQALSRRLKLGRLAVWAILREHTYETAFGDGYYAYVEQVFLSPSEAGLAIEAAGDKSTTNWHTRRYDLIGEGDRIHVRPSPTEAEPTTVDVLVLKLVNSGILQ